MRRLLALLFALMGCSPAVAQAYDENPSGRSLYALADLDLTAADGERGWLDGGFGKTRHGGLPYEGWRVHARAVEGDVVWQPHLAWSLDATVAIAAQQGQQQAVDLSEAYLSYRHDPIGAVRLSARLGLFWPPVSLEHGGPAWTVTETITPSAINSWIGEEVKVAAAEVGVTVPFGDGHLTATAALFGLNDTAGTLLTFRGWALHDEKATAFSLQPLPRLNAFMTFAQAPRTSPVIELDNRPGFYGRLGWSNARLALHGFYYDNRGDPRALDAYKQWGWRTRFAEVGAKLRLGNATSLTAQALTGGTRMGYSLNGRLWVDTGFRSAFGLLTREVGTGTSVSGRLEAFGTRGRGSVEGPASSEDGWAATFAVRHRLGDHASLLGELLHVDSKRAERARFGLVPEQRQTMVQLAARVAL